MHKAANAAAERLAPLFLGAMDAPFTLGLELASMGARSINPKLGLVADIAPLAGGTYGLVKSAVKGTPLLAKNFAPFVTNVANKVRKPLQDVKNYLNFDQFKGIYQGKGVNLQGLKNQLKAEMDTPDYLKRVKQAGFTDDQARTIIRDKKDAIQGMGIEFAAMIRPEDSKYMVDKVLIGTKGASKEEIKNSILHELGHSDQKVELEGVRLAHEANERIRPAFRREYFSDIPTGGRKPRWQYYGDSFEGTSEATQRAKAVIRYRNEYYPDKSLDEIYDIIQQKITNGEKLPLDVYDYVYSYNEPKSAKEFLRRAITLSSPVAGAGFIVGSERGDSKTGFPR